jgi:hypothetical protein
MHSNASFSNPNPPQASVVWADDAQFTGGIAGFDMSNVNDQLACIGGPGEGIMNLAAYRPGSGYIWFIHHLTTTPNSPSFGATFSTRSGLNGWCLDQQDRLVTLSGGNFLPASTDPEADNVIFCYRPGSGTAATANYTWTSGSPNGPSFFSFNGSNSSQLLLSDPYPNPPYVGDHVLCFTGYGGEYNTSILFYTPGANKQSQLYYQSSPGSGTYNEVY